MTETSAPQNASMNAVGWFDIFVDDLERATAFYETVFGRKLVPLGDPTGEMQMMSFPAEMTGYGAGGAISNSAYSRPGPGGTIVYFMAEEDCAVEEGRVVAAGGQVIRPKFSIGEHGFVSLIQDTEGNIAGISSMA